LGKSSAIKLIKLYIYINIIDGYWWILMDIDGYEYIYIYEWGI
jgi:hypothetical protein